MTALSAALLSDGAASAAGFVVGFPADLAGGPFGGDVAAFPLLFAAAGRSGEFGFVSRFALDFASTAGFEAASDLDFVSGCDLAAGLELAAGVDAAADFLLSAPAVAVFPAGAV